MTSCLNVLIEYVETRELTPWPSFRISWFNYDFLCAHIKFSIDKLVLIKAYTHRLKERYSYSNNRYEAMSKEFSATFQHCCPASFCYLPTEQSLYNTQKNPKQVRVLSSVTYQEAAVNPAKHLAKRTLWACRIFGEGLPPALLLQGFLKVCLH